MAGWERSLCQVKLCLFPDGDWGFHGVCELLQKLLVVKIRQMATVQLLPAACGSLVGASACHHQSPWGPCEVWKM